MTAITPQPGDLRIVSVHKLRSAARKRERELQEALDVLGGFEMGMAAMTNGEARGLLLHWDVPDEARGVRVEHAGFFQHAVVATENRGH